MRFFCTPRRIRISILHLRRMLHFHLCYKGILRSYQNSNLDSIVRSDKFFQLNYKTNCIPGGSRTHKPKHRILSPACLPVSSQGCLCERWDSNQDQNVRSVLFFRLNYKGKLNINNKIYQESCCNRKHLL